MKDLLPDRFQDDILSDVDFRVPGIEGAHGEPHSGTFA
jgi:hypothetical protein